MSISDPRTMWTIGATARRLGVAVTTLRSWDRRYGLGPSAHEAGAHRRYTGDDVDRLLRVVRLTHEGVPPAVAARLARDGGELAEPARDGGGTGSVAVGAARPAARGLARAATRLDVDGLRDAVAGHLAERGVPRTWEEVLVPLLRGLGEGGERDVDVIAAEHAATAAITKALHALPVPEASHRLPVLLGCAPDEQHALPLEALHAALGERGCASRFLGARLPPEALLWSVRKVRPKSVVIWAHTARHAKLVPLTRLREEPVALVPAGPGWSTVRAVADHPAPASLEEALEVVLANDGHRTGGAEASPPNATHP